MDHPWLPSHYRDRVKQLQQRHCGLQRLKYLLSDPLQEKYNVKEADVQRGKIN